MIEGNIQIKKFFIFNVQLFMGTSCSFKISKTTVYICPFESNYVKMKTTFSPEVTIKVTFPWKKKVSMIIVLTWIIPPLVTIITFPLHGLAPNMILKKIFPQWFELFKIKIPYLLCWKDTMIHWQFWAVSVKAFVRTAKLKTTDMECKSILKR